MIPFDENTFRETYEANVKKGFHDSQNTMLKQQLLMLVVTELSEAVEALRTKKRADMKKYYGDVAEKSFVISFLDTIKDTFDDELADACLRIFDYAGKYALSHHNIRRDYLKEMEANVDMDIPNPSAWIFRICKSVTDVGYTSFQSNHVGEAIGKIHSLANNMGVDLIKHIELKKKYNLTRPQRNGKEF